MEHGEQDSVSTALGIDLILRRIMQLSDFATLKKVRLVNKLWNETACSLLQKNCEQIKVGGPTGAKFEKFECDFQSYLPDSGILLKPQVLVTLEFADEFVGELDELNLHEFLQERIAGAPWLNQVVYLKLDLDLSSDDINRVTPFLLYHLPCLKTLKLALGYKRKLGENFPVPTLAPDATLALKDVEYRWFYFHYDDERDDYDAEIDPTFLLHCHHLKKIAFRTGTGRYSPIGEIFLGFYQNWKRTVEENPNFHRIRQLQLDFDYVSSAGPFETTILEAVVDFINLNEPTSLDVSGSMFNYSSALYHKVGLWTPSIQFLKMPVPSQSNQTPHADSALRMLKKCPCFAHLTEIYLHLEEVSNDGAGRMSILAHAPFPGRNSLPNVTKLTVDFGDVNASSVSVLRQIAGHFPNVTRFSLKLFRLVSRTSPWFSHTYLDAILGDCRLFRKLGHFCLHFMDRGAVKDSMENRVQAINKEQVSGGFLKNLSTFQCLSKLDIKVSAYDESWIQNNVVPYRIEEILIAFFHGFELEVPVEMDIFKWDEEGSPGFKRKFTPEELEQKLEEAEQQLLIGDS